MPGSTGRRHRPWYSRLVLLLWKNMLLRKRHWVLSLFEVFVPTLLFALLVSIKVLPDSAFTPELINETSIFPPASETLLRTAFCNSTQGVFYMGECHYGNSAHIGDRKFLWGPPTDFTRDLIERVRTDLNLNENELLEVSSNQELDDMVDALYVSTNESYASYYAGIFFHLDDPEQATPPQHLQYDLRLQKFWFTELVFPYLQIPGPRNFTGDLTYLGSYAAGGFTLLQSMVDRHYTAMASGNDAAANTIELETQMYPYPPYIQDNAMSQFYGAGLPLFVVLSLVLMSPSLIKSIVHEKETGVRELVRLMGLEGWLVWLGWFLHAFVMILLISTIMTFFLKIEITPSEATGLFPPILIYSDPFLIWIILMLYGISSIAFCFAISCFFSKPTLATTLGILIWLMSYFIPRGIMDAQYDTLGLAPKVLSCFLPNMAMTWAFRVISMFEGRAIGIQWDSLWQTGNPRDELTPALIMIMLCVDIILYFLITWYFDQVLPGKYGVPKPWYFPFQVMSGKKSKSGQGKGVSSTARGSAYTIDGNVQEQNFEQDPQNLSPGIVIKNLRKEFPALDGGIKVAVEDVSLTCYEGQCTVLLGHNGAGKTTTMSVITGVYTSSGGTASILGHDITTNLKEARAEVGLCPQHNTLFADLSVMNHLMFFAQLKGLTKSEARKEAKQLLEKMQLTEKKDQYGKQLSGGMKRKLCLCIALIGGSKVVILDEPSSGLDPESRRWVWDAVQRERGQRTMLVTTHHMEEADVLGDRVAIMASGRVVCAGSTLFLKKRFGDGYSLRVLPQKGCIVPVVTSTVRNFLPDSALSSSTQEELIYSLSSDTQRFPDLLQDLTDKKKYLKINHVGLSLTSMEQVFLKVGESLDPIAAEQEKIAQGYEVASASGSGKHIPLTAQTSNGLSRQSLTNDDTEQLFKGSSILDSRLSGNALFFERLKSLWMKRAIYTKRKWVLLLTQGLIPVLVTLMCLLVDAAFFGENAAQPPRSLELDMFEWTESFIEEIGDVGPVGDCYRQLFVDPYHVDNTVNMTNSLLEVARKDIFHYRENYVTSAIFEETDDKMVTRMLYQSIPFHAPGVGLNLISNALLQCTAGEDYHISTSNYPLPYDQRYRLDNDGTSGSALIYAMMMPTALAFLSASFLVFPLQERHSKAKQIQVMTGTPAWMLWLTSFTWDLLSYSTSALLVFACFLILDSQGFFTLPGAPGALWLLLFSYGFGGIPLAYLFSFPFSTSASGFAILALVNILTGLVISTATWALNSSEQPGLLVLSAVLGNISSLVPAYPAAKAFLHLIDTGTYNTQCDIVDPSLVESLCADLYEQQIPSPFLACCRPQCEAWSICFEELPYLQWDSPGMGADITWMFCDGIIFMSVLLLLEAGVGDLIRNLYWKAVRAMCKTKSSVSYIVPEDDDVIEEARMARLQMTDGASNAALVVDGLRKEFLGVGLTAVSNISFRVAKGECFGLLGVNGAGKTTTFRMLTGDEVPSAGDARIGNVYLSQNRNKFVQEIGYCPQFDALLEELTGDEMLSLMAGLRGVPHRQRKALIEDLVQLVDLTECHKRETSTYSGGNKRKLSTAMALVGGPPLVFLDEPTTGVDPASRRRVWSAIRAARRQGQSIILTSHSMDECEALCSRLVIMVRGQLRCEGSPAHLKAKFSLGYSLQVKLNNNINQQQQQSEADFDRAVASLQQTIYTQLPGSKLTDQHRGMLAYLVPPNISWSTLFRVMEELKTEGFSTLVEDYAATDPSLEQVFLTFAREADLGTSVKAGDTVAEQVTQL